MVAISPTSMTESQAQHATSDLWLRDKRWDLIFLTFSVVVVPLPYLVYLFGRDMLGINDDLIRNVVNGFVAVAIGGPHMMSTFLRTGLDNTFKKQYPMLIRSSIIIPIIVIALAFLNLTLLLTVFFFWASLHVLHQITYVVELYNHKEYHYVRRERTLSMMSRGIDYAVILTCLFPIAALKISQGNFDIGTNDLTAVIPTVFQQTWFFIFMSGVFFVSAAVYLSKTYLEYRQGYFNQPKTLFILFTVIAAFTIPMLPNLDTAFQGLNTWHSFQYLALTFYIIKIRQQYGKLRDDAPLVARLSTQSQDSRYLYGFSALMLVGSLAIFIVVFVLGGLVRSEMSLNQQFDTAYYTSILAFLWIHYYHDHFLFTDFESLDDVYQNTEMIAPAGD